jgi:hypothetical protein
MIKTNLPLFPYSLYLPLIAVIASRSYALSLPGPQLKNEEKEKEGKEYVSWGFEPLFLFGKRPSASCLTVLEWKCVGEPNLGLGDTRTKLLRYGH